MIIMDTSMKAGVHDERAKIKNLPGRWVTIPGRPLKSSRLLVYGLIEPFINTGNALAATYAGSYHAIFLVAALHFVEKLHRKPGACRA